MNLHTCKLQLSKKCELVWLGLCELICERGILPMPSTHIWLAACYIASATCSCQPVRAD